MLGIMDLSTTQNLLKLLLNGAVTTLEIFALTLLFSLPLGLFIALGRMSHNKLLSTPIKWYITIVRGTPLILQIMFVYFGPDYVLPESLKPNLDRFVAAIIAMTLNYAAYFAEIYRGGIESIPSGQHEAAAVLGFTKTQTFMKIILPQVIKRILPPISNEVITLVKDTALVQVIGVSELFRVASNELTRIASTTPLLIAGFFYLVMNSIVEKILHLLEQKLSYYK